MMPLMRSYTSEKTDMINKPDDKVKVIYHPDFITPTNPLFGMDYPQFVRGCHLGIFLLIMNPGDTHLSNVGTWCTCCYK